MHGPSGGPAVSPRLCTPVLDRWVPRVYHRAAHAFWAVGPTATLPGQRPSPEAALDALTAVALCASGETISPSPADWRAPPGGLRERRRSQARVSPPRVADQHRLH